jgi:taurine dioxygenase
MAQSASARESEAPHREIGPGDLAAAGLKPFGAEVTGDLARPLTADARQFLRAQIDTHGLILARNQRLPMQQHRDLASVVGPVLGDQHDLHYVDLQDGVLGADALAFHSDFAFAHTPLTALSLHAVDVVDGETSTRFASGTLAYDRLSDAQRQRLAHLTATAVSTSTIGRRVGYYIPKKAHCFTRPALMQHPRTGRPILYVNEGQTARFNELDEPASDAFLAELFAILYAPDAVLEHPWSNGDIVLWDNLMLQHGRRDLHRATRRRLQRVSVAECSPVDMFPTFIPGDPTD